MSSHRFAAALAAALAAFGPAAAHASVNADQVQSVHLREADGTSGQNTNAGSGVKTGHIQDGAVTASKIAGPLPATLIDRNGLDADKLDGRHAADFSPAGHTHAATELQGIGAYQRSNRNVLVVAKDGTGDFTDPAQALAATADASQSNPYLVKVMPGEYTTTSLQVGSYVDLEGSGQGTTRIVVPADNQVTLMPSSEVRNVTVQCDGCTWVNAQGAANAPARFSRTTLLRTGAFPAGYNFRFVQLSSAELESSSVIVDLPGAPGEAWTQPEAIGAGNGTIIRDSLIRVGGGTSHGVGLIGQAGDVLVEGSRILIGGGYDAQAVDNYGAQLVIRSSTLVATGSSGGSYGVLGVLGKVTVEGSSIVANGPWNGIAVLSGGGGGSVSLANTRVEGSVSGPGLACFGVYGATFAPVSCP